MISPNYIPATVETTGNTPVADIVCPVPVTDELSFGRVLGPKRFSARPSELFVSQEKILGSARAFADGQGWGYEELLAKAASRVERQSPIASGQIITDEEVERILTEDDAFFGF